MKKKMGKYLYLHAFEEFKNVFIAKYFDAD